MKFLGATSSGSLADTVFSRNRYGQYQRRRATPVNPATAAQTTARQTLATLASGWAGIGTTDRLAWEAWANAHPRTDSLGQTVTLSGMAMYVSTNAALLASQLTIVTTPPAQEPDWPSLTLTLSMSVTGGVNLTFTGMVTHYIVQVWAGKQGSPGVAFDHDQRLITVINPGDTSPRDITSLYVARWGPQRSGARFHYAFRRIWDEGAVDVFLRNFGDTGA